MDAILNNPFRILGLSASATDVEIKERYTLLVNNLNDIEKIVAPVNQIFNKIEIDGKSFLNGNDSHYYSSDEPGFQLYRSLNTIADAYAKLQDPINKAFYSLFAFELSEFNSQFSNTDEIFEKWVNKFQIIERRKLEIITEYEINLINSIDSIKRENYFLEKGWKSVKIKNLTESGWLIESQIDNQRFRAKLGVNENFCLECVCQWIEGIDNNAYNIYWGKEFNKSSYFKFGISANGYVQICHVEDGIVKNDNDFFGWKKVDSIKKNGINHLQVSNFNNSLEFFVNNILVHKTEKYHKVYGTELGILVFGKQTVEFSNFKINFFKEQIAYAEGLILNNHNFSIIKNVSIYYFIKSFVNLQLEVYKGKNGLTNEYVATEYCPKLAKYYHYKAIILLGKLLVRPILEETNIIPLNLNSGFEEICIKFAKDLLTNFHAGSDIGIANYHHTVLNIRFFDNLIKESLVQNIKDELKKSPGIPNVNEKDNIEYSFKINAFSIIPKTGTFFLGTINNPYRVLGLNAFTSEKELQKRVSDLKIYNEVGKSTTFENDIFYGLIDRSNEKVVEAGKILENNNKRLYYSLLWFIEETEIDKEYINYLRKINNIENDEYFKNELINSFPSYKSRNYNFENALDKITNEYYWEFENNVSYKVKSLYEIKKVREYTEYCIHEDITELFPAFDNVEKTPNSLIINNTNEDTLLQQNIYFDKNSDFRITCCVERFEGENYGCEYSFILGNYWKENFYQYGILSDGNVFFHEVSNGVKIDLLDRSRCRFIETKDGLPVTGKSDNKSFNENIINWTLTYDSKENCFHLSLNGESIKVGVKYLATPYIYATGDTKIESNIGIKLIGKQKTKVSEFKFFYTHSTELKAKKTNINKHNFSSLINYIVHKLCIASFIEKEAIENTCELIALWGLILNNELFIKHASKVLGDVRKIDIEKIEQYFADDMYDFAQTYLSKKDGINVREYYEAFYSFSENTQKFVLHRLFGKKIIEIEEEIISTADQLKKEPLKGIEIGERLILNTFINLYHIREILTYSSYHYRVIANNLANKIIDCAIVYYNSKFESVSISISESKKLLYLIDNANKIALEGSARKRADENLIFFKEKIDSESKRIVTATLNKLTIFFENKTQNIKSINDLKQFITECKSTINNLNSYDNTINSYYSSLSNTLINSTLTFLIDSVAEIERGPMNHKIDLEIRYGLLLDQGLEVFKELNELQKSQQTQQRLDKYTRIFQDKLKVFNEPLSKDRLENKPTNPVHGTTTKSEPAPPIEQSQNSVNKSAQKKWNDFKSLKQKLIPKWIQKKYIFDHKEEIFYIFITAGFFIAIIALIIKTSNSEHNSNVLNDTKSSQSITSDSKINQGVEPNTRIEPEISKWIGNKLPNGSTPYINIWGHGIFDPNSDCYVVFKNGNNTDAIVCLEDVNDGSIIRNSYIQAGTNYKMKKLPIGSYKIKVFYGNDWNPEKMINNGVIKGGFENNIHFSISERESDWLKVFYDSKTYSYGEITLYTVNDGNMQQRSINSNDFFK